ncbi:transmembrane protein 101 [Geospiza fortis]|uniref:Transmembrane protein 101 n=1 Tax=Geospiza fortis TaxID=48883 RepID=A0A8N5I583_GEOFO|nr:transmembrane protein 101 [Geospiza fortis]
MSLCPSFWWDSPSQNSCVDVPTATTLQVPVVPGVGNLAWHQRHTPLRLSPCPLLSPQAYSLQHSTEDRLAYLDHLLGGELALQLLFLLYGLLALAFLSGYYVRTAAQVLAVLLPLAILLIDGNLGYWHALRRVEFWNQMKLIGQNVGIFGAVVILATDG